MSFDLGNTAIEIAIALVFVFVLLSLIVTELTELFANAMKLRAKTLKEGLEGMLGDSTVARQVLDHPLVRVDLGKKKRDPSYITARDFAVAFRDLVEPPSGAASDSRATVRVTDSSGESHTSEIKGKLATQLRTLSGSASAIPAMRGLEKWFDDSMDRVTGWYKRRTKWITLGLATLVVLGLNVSSVRIAERLSEEPTVRAAVVAKAEAAADKGGGEDDEALKSAGKSMEGAVKELDALKLPIFWAGENVPNDLEDWGVSALGWLITIVAISLGAPFWFDTLGKLSNLRMAGKKPEEKAAGA